MSKGLLIAVLASIVLIACAAPTWTKEEVVRLSDGNLCYLNMVQPIGMVPLEVERRGLNCGDPRIAYEILDQASREVESSSNFTIPLNLLNSEDCQGVSLGNIENPRVTKQDLGIATLQSTDYRHYQQVVNGTSNTKFVFINAIWSSTAGPRRLFMKLLPRETKLVRLGGYGTSPYDVKFAGCRSF